MFESYEKYLALPVKGELIGLQKRNDNEPYFCYPENAKAIGFEGSIMYCFIEPYGEMVFACDPESCADIFVYPLARTFDDFLGLILACGSTNPVEQIVWMSEEQFAEHLKEEEKRCTQEQRAALHCLERELEVLPAADPFHYVKVLQTDFDYSAVKFSDEYYDVTGLERE